MSTGTRIDTRPCPKCGAVAHAEHRQRRDTSGVLDRTEPFSCDDCGWVEGDDDGDDE